MTWTCPGCGRDYPDSGVGVPRSGDAREKEGCAVCWVSPVGTSRYVRPDSVDATEVLEDE
jgi:hypothetical protein